MQRNAFLTLSPAKRLGLLAFTLLVVLLTSYLLAVARQNHLNQSLIASILRNDPVKVTSLLHQGADPNTVYVAHRHTSLWQQVLSSLFARNRKDVKSPSALQVCCDINVEGHALETIHPDIVRALLEQGANPNVSDEEGCTPLMNSFFFLHEEIPLLLIEHGADVNARSKDGVTPLDFAINFRIRHWDDDAVLISLLQHGARVNDADTQSFTALHWSIIISDVAGARILLAHGADPTMKVKAHGKAKALGDAVAVAKLFKNPVMIALMESSMSQRKKGAKPTP